MFFLLLYPHFKSTIYYQQYRLILTRCLDKYQSKNDKKSSSNCRHSCCCCCCCFWWLHAEHVLYFGQIGILTVHVVEPACDRDRCYVAEIRIILYLGHQAHHHVNDLPQKAYSFLPIAIYHHIVYRGRGAAIEQKNYSIIPGLAPWADKGE